MGRLTGMGRIPLQDRIDQRRDRANGTHYVSAVSGRLIREVS
jgi:hypothetical protein